MKHLGMANLKILKYGRLRTPRHFAGAESMEGQEIVQQVGKQVTDNASVKTVFGDAVTLDGKRVIPVAKVVGAFGGGGGSNEPKSKTGSQQSGGGGGGGFRAMPVGVVEITADSTRFIRFGATRRMVGAFAIGMLVGMVLRARPRRGLPKLLRVGRELLL
jgi:uncharacterized spore protein YtfJ